VSATWRSWRRWAFALVPALGLFELAAHAMQTRSVVPDAEWASARAYVESHAKPEDLVAFSPRWVDPIGRQFFGPALATVEREAPADGARFRRAFEVSIRGATLPLFNGWHRGAQQRFGALTVSEWDNPAPAPVIDDLVSMVAPTRLRVSRGQAPCTFVHDGAQSGGLGFGPGIPADRFVCPGGGLVAVSVVADLNYDPHRCIYAPPPGGVPVRLRFQDVRFGRSLYGHHALYVEAERDRRGAPVTIDFMVNGAQVGAVVHRDGDGWKPFEFDTAELAGKSGELDVEITSPSGDRRMYCFEAATR
jgi:hypothetical protein